MEGLLSPAGLAGLSFCLLLVAVLWLRMPIAVLLALLGIGGTALLSGTDAARSLLSTELWSSFSSYGMTVVPLFIFMGQVCFYSGLNARLYKSLNILAGHVPGGLSVATLLACGGFSAICGSNTATAATMAGVALPEMRRYGYQGAFAAGTVAVGATLGVVIPPSVVLIVISLQTGLSVSRLFLASVVPGILLLAFFEPFLYFIGETFGIKATNSPTLSALIIAIIPIVTMFADMLFYKTRIAAIAKVGVLITLPGTLLMVLKKDPSTSVYWWGIALLMLAVFSSCGYSITVRRLVDKYSAITINTWQFCLGAVFFLVCPVELLIIALCDLPRLGADVADGGLHLFAVGHDAVPRDHRAGKDVLISLHHELAGKHAQSRCTDKNSAGKCPSLGHCFIPPFINILFLIPIWVYLTICIIL